MQSDTESNVSSFRYCNNDNIKYLYNSMIKGMELINHDLLEVEKNLKGLAKQAGPFESQLNALLLSLPKQPLNMSMETEG